MKRTKPSARFWAKLGLANVLALAYPIWQVAQTDNDAGGFAATLILIAVVFLLLITDAVGILVACWS